MVKIKSAEAIDKAYRDAISRVPERYKEGVSTVTDWQEKALAGQKNYEEQMTKPEVLARRARALEKVSTDEWRRKAAELGTKRIADGMRANADKRRANYEPIRKAIEAATLPPRTTDPYENIRTRVTEIVKVMRKASGKE